MEAAADEVAGFVSHVWFVATALQELHQSTADTARLSIEATLAWQQLDEQTRERWRNVAELAVRRFEETPEHQRKRWARTGTSLRTASTLEELASEIRTELSKITDRKSPIEAFGLIAAQDRLLRLLSVSEAVPRRFRLRRNAPASTSISVDLQAMITDWLGGLEIGDLGEKYLAVVSDEVYRYEKLSEFISQVLEHILPWLLNTLVTCINEGLADDEQLCSDLPAYIRFGVDSPVSLELSRSGVRSRRLAHVVAKLAANQTPASIRDWLAANDLRGWAESFAASPTELADLLYFTRAASANISSRVLDGEIVDIPIRTVPGATAGTVELVEGEEPAPPRLVVQRDGVVLGYVAPNHQRDLNRSLGTGVPLETELTEALRLHIRVIDPTQRASWFTQPLAP